MLAQTAISGPCPNILFPSTAEHFLVKSDGAFEQDQKHLLLSYFTSTEGL